LRFRTNQKIAAMGAMVHTREPRMESAMVTPRATAPPPKSHAVSSGFTLARLAEVTV
jgi:hypothetical protein